MDREQTIHMLLQRSRQADSAMVRVLSRDEIDWLVEPLLPELTLVETREPVRAG